MRIGVKKPRHPLEFNDGPVEKNSPAVERQSIWRKMPGERAARVGDEQGSCGQQDLPFVVTPAALQRFRPRG
jgi:hypothetical protein